MRRLTLLIAVAIVVLAPMGPALAAPGDLVNGFGGSGVVTVSVQQGDEWVAALDLYGHKVVSAGWTSDTADRDATLLRLRPDGGSDGSFGGNGVVVTGRDDKDEEWTDLNVQKDGTVTAFGAFDRGAGGDVDTAIGRFLANGRPDRSFGRKGVRILDLDPDFDAPAAAIRVKDFYLIAGRIGVLGPDDMFIAKLSLKGRLVTSYGQGGIRRIDVGGLSDGAETLHRAPDGGTYVGGWGVVGGNRNMVLAKVDAGGDMDLNFGAGGVSVLAVEGARTGFDLSLDGQLVVLAGDALNGFTYDPAIAVFQADGDPEPSFGGGDGIRVYPFQLNDNAFHSVFVTGDTYVVAGGADIATELEFLLMRIEDDGDPDPTFGGGDGIASTLIEDRSVAWATIRDGSDLYLGGFAMDGTFSVAAYALYSLT